MFNETTWKDGETMAQEYMKQNGYKILHTNFSCIGVELDIVAICPKRVQIKNMKKQLKEKLKYAVEKEAKISLKEAFKKMKGEVNDLLVITEVKARSNNDFGTGAEAVNLYKQKNIIAGAKFYQNKYKYFGYQIRFDVASVDAGTVTYIEDAFFDKIF